MVEAGVLISIPVIYAAGITTIASPNGFIIPVYIIEKTICDKG